MNDSEIKTASREAVHEVLSSLGFDTSNKIAMQSQMASLRQVAELMKDDDFRADMIHLRKWRMATERVSVFGVTAVISIIISGIAGALWIGFKVLVAK